MFHLIQRVEDKLNPLIDRVEKGDIHCSEHSKRMSIYNSIEGRFFFYQKVFVLLTFTTYTKSHFITTFYVFQSK